MSMVFNIALYASPRVRQQYSERHNGHYPQVQPNDIAFAVHALALSFFTLGQSFVYKRDANQRVSDINRGVLSFLFASIAVGGVLVSAGKFVELDLVLWLSYIKLYISGAKMVPQVWLNYRRKSTVGWSIENILLDFTGGTLSLAQLVLDSLLDNDWRGITGNPGKLGLSFLTLGFDIVFIVQHFVLYRHNREEGDAQDDDGQTERDRLLPRRHTDPIA
ncbi:hypothetical protein Rhopal_003839-T1 [Rhodotorula paludigena]|uniref:Cystinosin n=1 Tax=Rhodotorula paludigena TaxID=86838 RepID=A0AAV5GMT4_9BASI|nr:hypothetical protein Rhopal_003839-T1 [Rhodotorula paludigena]